MKSRNTPIYEVARHEALQGAEWDEALALAAVRAIAADAHAAFDTRDRSWPAHPLDEPETRETRWHMLYFGTGGVIWALQRLAALEIAPAAHDYGPVVSELVERNRAVTEAWGYGTGSYLMGDAGLLLLRWLQQRDHATEQQLADVVSSNMHHPACEQLWGNAGSMLAALHMAEATDRNSWRRLFERAAQMLHVQMEHDRERGLWLWRQDLYGRQRYYLGAGHGFAGNVYPLLRGRELLPPGMAEEIAERATLTLRRTALHDDGRVNWLPLHDASHELPQLPLVQDCHGAPGMLSRLAALQGEGCDELLEGAGELVWTAGPLTKGPGLCHGTAGNGWALLKLWRRTGSELWLQRARAFAMHALDQVARERVRHGRGRYSLWTGDVGVALFAVACLRGDDRLPLLDVV